MVFLVFTAQIAQYDPGTSNEHEAKAPPRGFSHIVIGVTNAERKYVFRENNSSSVVVLLCINLM